MQALIQSIEAVSKAPEETAEKIARAWEDDRKGRQESQDSQRKAAEESNRKWDDLRELYRDKEVFGAVAALSFDLDSDKYAWRRGMFVLKPAHWFGADCQQCWFSAKALLNLRLRIRKTHGNPLRRLSSLTERLFHLEDSFCGFE